MVVKGIKGSNLRQTHQGNCKHSSNGEHHIWLGTMEGSPEGGTEGGIGCAPGLAQSSVM